MKKILFPTEFSPHAGRIFLYALDLAKKKKASVTLLYAYHVPLNPALSMNDIGNEAMKSLQQFAKSMTPKEYRSVEVHFIAEMGFAVDAILKVAREEEMDLIVMGMKGKTNALEAYFGSVALDVVSKTDLPVLLIPSTNRFKPIQKITYAFDFKMTDLLCLEQITNLFGNLKSSITCVHFNEEEEDGYTIEKTVVLLSDLFKHHPKYKTVSFFTNNGKFEKGIQDYVIQNNTDLLITQSHTRNWKFRFVEPSSSNQIARKINIPMLILKETKSTFVLEKYN